MPRLELMNWDAPQYRWRKLYKGAKYSVTCAQLGLPQGKWTKADSLGLANQWWTAKQGELAPKLAVLEKRLDYTRRHGLDAEGEVIQEEILSVRNSPHSEIVLDNSAVERVSLLNLMPGVSIDLATADPVVLNSAFGSQTATAAVWSDRFAREGDASGERSVGAASGRWVAGKLAKHTAGALSPGAAGRAKFSITKFVKFVGADCPVAAINHAVWEQWCYRLVGAARQGTLSPATLKTEQGASRDFLKWCVTNSYLDKLPSNFDDRGLRVLDTSRHRDVIVFTVDQVKTLLAACEGKQLRCVLLLMLNCGLQQQDIARLEKSMVDLDQRTLTWQRFKTRHKTADAPVVVYPLWDETVSELRRWWSDDERLVLLNENGIALVREVMKGDKVSKTDAVRLAYLRLLAKTKLSLPPLRHFRKTSASIISNNPKYYAYRYMFLANSERGIPDQHYVLKCKNTFREAVLWLGEKYGVS